MAHLGDSLNFVMRITAENIFFSLFREKIIFAEQKLPFPDFPNMLIGGLIFRYYIEESEINEESVCFRDSNKQLTIEFPPEEQNQAQLIEFISSCGVSLNKKNTVYFHNGYVFKFCDKEEYEMNIEFLKSNPSITPKLIASDKKEYIIITKYAIGYKSLKQYYIENLTINIENFEKALKFAFSNFGTLTFRSDLINLSNIGYNSKTKSVIFYEQTGKRIYEDQTREGLYVQYLDELKNQNIQKYNKIIKKI